MSAAVSCALKSRPDHAASAPELLPPLAAGTLLLSALAARHPYRPPASRRYSSVVSSVKAASAYEAASTA